MLLRQLIEYSNSNVVPSSGLEFTPRGKKQYVVTHSDDHLPVFTITRGVDNNWRTYTNDGSLVLPPQLNKNVLFQKVRQFYDDREEMSAVGDHPNKGKADRIARHLYDVLRNGGKHGKKDVQLAFQKIVDRDQPKRWEIMVIKDKFLRLTNPPVTESERKHRKHEKPLSPEERKKVNDADLESSIWKSVDPKTGKTTYVASTHRASATAPTLKGAISKAKDYIDSTG